MKTVSSCVKSSVEDIHEPKKMCKAFQDISTYFSEEEWAKRTTWQKSVYVYMKRNYIRMTALGVTVNQPVFMRCKQQAKEFLVECIEVHGHDSEDEHSEVTFGIKPTKRLKLTPLNLDPHNENGRLASEDAAPSPDSNLPGAGNIQVNAWSHRLRKRKKQVTHKEIKDPKKDDDDGI
uniref:protein SSX1-like n=1 Tax=Myodes glareolus TaxID=447135 RepID=UPI0020223A36|nr:protein SSX1-like [Myodes glareolus]